MATAGAFRVHTRADWLAAPPNLRAEGGDGAQEAGGDFGGSIRQLIVMRIFRRRVCVCVCLGGGGGGC